MFGIGRQCGIGRHNYKYSVYDIYTAMMRFPATSVPCVILVDIQLTPLSMPCRYGERTHMCNHNYSKC